MKGYKTGGIPVLEDQILPAVNKNYFDKAVVVLINGTTISAGELMAEYMRQINFVTIMGDTTNGAGCADIYEEIEGDYFLPSGRYIKVGNSYALRFDGVPIEWNGIPPDVLIQQSRADFIAGRDKQLESAINFLK